MVVLALPDCSFYDPDSVTARVVLKEGLLLVHRFIGSFTWTYEGLVS